MSSKKKIGKKKISFRSDNEDRPVKRVKVEKVKYRNMNTWLEEALD